MGWHHGSPRRCIMENQHAYFLVPMGDTGGHGVHHGCRRRCRLLFDAADTGVQLHSWNLYVHLWITYPNDSSRSPGRLCMAGDCFHSDEGVPVPVALANTQGHVVGYEPPASRRSHLLYRRFYPFLGIWYLLATDSKRHISQSDLRLRLPKLEHLFDDCCATVPPSTQDVLLSLNSRPNHLLNDHSMGSARPKTRFGITFYHNTLECVWVYTAVCTSAASRIYRDSCSRCAFSVLPG